MWLQLAFIILPSVSVVCFLLSLYGHKIENKKLKRKIKLSENKNPKPIVIVRNDKIV